MLRSSVRFARGRIVGFNVLWSLFYSLPLSGEEADLVIDIASDGNEQRKLVRIVCKSKINRGKCGFRWILFHRFKKVKGKCKRQKYKSTINKTNIPLIFFSSSPILIIIPEASILSKILINFFKLFPF